MITYIFSLFRLCYGNSLDDSDCSLTSFVDSGIYALTSSLPSESSGAAQLYIANQSCSSSTEVDYQSLSRRNSEESNSDEYFSANSDIQDDNIFHDSGCFQDLDDCTDSATTGSISDGSTILPSHSLSTCEQCLRHTHCCADHQLQGSGLHLNYKPCDFCYTSLTQPLLPNCSCKWSKEEENDDRCVHTANTYKFVNV